MKVGKNWGRYDSEVKIVNKNGCVLKDFSHVFIYFNKSGLVKTLMLWHSPDRVKTLAKFLRCAKRYRSTKTIPSNCVFDFFGHVRVCCLC